MLIIVIVVHVKILSVNVLKNVNAILNFHVKAYKKQATIYTHLASLLCKKAGELLWGFRRLTGPWVLPGVDLDAADAPTPRMWSEPALSAMGT